MSRPMPELFAVAEALALLAVRRNIAARRAQAADAQPDRTQDAKGRHIRAL